MTVARIAREVRTLALADAGLELRDRPPGEPPRIRGYAAVFDRDSEPLKTTSGRSFRERVAPGAFRLALLTADVRALFNHRADYILGRQSAGTLRLAEDARGLRYEIDPPDTSYARDLIASIRRGDVTGSSFSFATIADEWADGGDGVPIRTLKDVHIYDVGPVTFPAYADTSAACRSLELRPRGPGGLRARLARLRSLERGVHT